VKYLGFVCVSAFNVLLADSVVLPTEKYETIPLPPLTNDLIKKENIRQRQYTLGKIEQIVKKDKNGCRQKSEMVDAPQLLSSGGAWDSLKNPALEKIVRNLLENQYVNLNKINKNISLNLKKADIKRVFELIGKISGVRIVVDSDIQGMVKNLDLKDIPVVSALRLLTTSNNPPLVVLQDEQVVRVARLSTAIDLLKAQALNLLEKDYENTCITICHAKWNEDLKTRLESLWKGIIESGAEKDQAYIVFDGESKKILCHARKAQIKTFKEFVTKIDVQVPQVKIDARIVLASKDFEESLGFDWSGYYDKRALVSHTDFAGFGAKKSSGDDDFFKNSVNWSMNFVPALSTISSKIPIKLPFIWGNKNFDSNRLNLILQAAETRDQIRTVLKPSLLVNNDELAEILVGEQMPHETRIAETVEGQPSNVTTTQYKDIGMKVKIKPVVTPESDSVFLDVFVENSYIARPKFRFDQDDKGFNYVIETSRSQNKVLLKSGQTTMIGGLIISTKERVQTGVPFLQDIPVLGLFFQGRRKSVIEKQLLIFITPTIT
jgi:type IV pilus assembly protein PilQ